jgi:hypothetical protein
MSTLKTNNVQVGQSVTATNNFTIYQPSSPDGTVRIGVGNSGATTADVITANSSGNVGIGTSSPVAGARLAVVGGGVQLSGGTSAQEGIRIQRASGVATFTGINNDNNAFNPIAFFTSGTEAARIDTNGNLLVGYNKAQIWDELISGSRNTNAVVGGFYSSSSSYTSSVIRCQTETAAGTGWYFFEGRASGGSFQYGIRGNGTVATSDERRKKNVEPARSYLSDVCSIPVVKYNWKTDSDDAPKELGWLAQDVAKVFPNMVVTHHDGPNDDQEVLLLKKEVFLPMLMKCIQEQQAMIETLQAKVTALEAKG